MLKNEQNMEYKNLISIRVKESVNEIQRELKKIRKFLQERGLKKKGPMINTTFKFENKNGNQIMDMEYLFPVDRKVDKLPDNCTFKEKFYLKNAIYMRHEGNPQRLQETYNKLNEYAKENNLRQITSGYNAFIKEPQNLEEIENAIIDVYIGIDENIL